MKQSILRRFIRIIIGKVQGKIIGTHQAENHLVVQFLKTQHGVSTQVGHQAPLPETGMNAYRFS